MSTATQRKPERTTRHRQLEAAIWANDGEKGTWYNVSLTKSWKAGDEWKKSAASFGSEDLLPCSKLLDWADYRIGQAIEKSEKAETEKKPLASKKRGLLECAVWHKVGEDGDVYYVSLKRSYKDGNDWKDTLVWLGAREILSAGRLLVRSFDAIDELYAEAAGSSFLETAKQEFNATEDGPPDEDIPF
jgi:hypothetical protein